MDKKALLVVETLGWHLRKMDLMYVNTMKLLKALTLIKERDI